MYKEKYKINKNQLYLAQSGFSCPYDGIIPITILTSGFGVHCLVKKLHPVVIKKLTSRLSWGMMQIISHGMSDPLPEKSTSVVV